VSGWLIWMFWVSLRLLPPSAGQELVFQQRGIGERQRHAVDPVAIVVA
jgi:hypothetical protein